jgi:hypothetical protein
MEVKRLWRGARSGYCGLHASETYARGFADSHDETRVVEVVTVSTEAKHKAVA